MSQLNLLPEYYARQRFRYRVDLICVVLFAVVMAGIMITERRSSRMMAEAEGSHRDVTTRLKMGAEFAGAFFELQGERDRMLDAAKESAEFEEHVPRSFLIYMVARSLPKGASLLTLNIGTRLARARVGTRPKKVSLTAKGAADEAPPVAVTFMEIQGVAETDSQAIKVLTSLQNEPWISEANLRYTRELVVNKKPYREFSIECTLISDLDVMDVIREEKGLTPRSGSLFTESTESTESTELAEPAKAKAPSLEGGS